MPHYWMFWNSRSRSDVKEGKNKFFIAETCFPQTIDVVEGRAKNLGIEMVVGNPDTFTFDATFFGALVQYPDAKGNITDIKSFISKAKESGVQVAVAADMLG